MGKRVIAECVENEQILTLLAELGVDYAQGYHVGRPRMLSDLVAEYGDQMRPSQAV
ncbi:MAG: EAL domain-containing protein [Gammaproteobacteria bacterium]|nr:EAL domain-containing protein [Gammaproteobacteria bacterium]